MTDERSEEKHEAVDKHAVTALEVLLKDLEDNHGDEQYEIKFLGDLYARMIVSVYMGYLPEKLGKDAEEGAIRLMKASGVDMEEAADRDERSEEKHEAVDKHAVTVLEVLLKDLEDNHCDRDWETISPDSVS